jgi:hypothetical protein
MILLRHFHIVTIDGGYCTRHTAPQARNPFLTCHAVRRVDCQRKPLTLTEERMA